MNMIAIYPDLMEFYYMPFCGIDSSSIKCELGIVWGNSHYFGVRHVENMELLTHQNMESWASQWWTQQLRLDWNTDLRLLIPNSQAMTWFGIRTIRESIERMTYSHQVKAVGGLSLTEHWHSEGRKSHDKTRGVEGCLHFRSILELSSPGRHF